MTTYKEEIQTIVLNTLLDKNLNPINDTQWRLAYEIQRANDIIETLNWKIKNLTVSL